MGPRCLLLCQANIGPGVAVGKGWAKILEDFTNLVAGADGEVYAIRIQRRPDTVTNQEISYPGDLNANIIINNFFCANRRIILKERRGSKYYKKYDDPATPCDRLLASKHLTELQKTWLIELRSNLDPYKLRKLIDAKQREIFRKLR